MSRVPPITTSRRTGATRPLAALMEDYVDGSRAAFVRLHARLRPIVRRQIAARVRAPADVEDLIQQTFLNLHAARGRYVVRSGDGAVLAWVCTIARNTAIGHLRRVGRERLRFDSTAEGAVALAACTAPAPGEHQAQEEIRNERRQAIRQAVAQLPTGQRQVVERSKFEGAPLKEVACELGLRPVAARVRVHRAYKVLRPRLAHLAAPMHGGTLARVG